MTEIKVGWARRDYGRDRFDVAIDLADLPEILAEQGADPAQAGTIPYSKKLDILRAFARMTAMNEYLRREAADAGWQQGEEASAPMRGAKKDMDAAKAKLAALVGPYRVKEQEPAGT